VVVKTIKLCKSQPQSDWKVKLTPNNHIQWSTTLITRVHINDVMNPMLRSLPHSMMYKICVALRKDVSTWNGSHKW
jgi:hypothetical protein